MSLLLQAVYDVNDLMIHIARTKSMSVTRDVDALMRNGYLRVLHRCYL